MSPRRFSGASTQRQVYEESWFLVGMSSLRHGGGEESDTTPKPRPDFRSEVLAIYGRDGSPDFGGLGQRGVRNRIFQL